MRQTCTQAREHTPKGQPALTRGARSSSIIGLEPSLPIGCLHPTTPACRLLAFNGLPRHALAPPAGLASQLTHPPTQQGTKWVWMMVEAQGILWMWMMVEAQGIKWVSARARAAGHPHSPVTHHMRCPTHPPMTRTSTSARAADHRQRIALHCSWGAALSMVHPPPSSAGAALAQAHTSKRGNHSRSAPHLCSASASSWLSALRASTSACR